MNFENLIYLIIILIILKFINKKLKKYKKIYLNDGFDGIWFYFINKNIKKTGLKNSIDKRKKFIRKKNRKKVKK